VLLLFGFRWLTPPANFDAALRASAQAVSFTAALEQLPKPDFLRAWCAVAYSFPGLHPEGYEDAGSDWPRVLQRFAAEAWRRADAGELAEEERQKDPFGVFGVIGAEFSSGDGDDYACLCRKAKADHVTEINRLFEDSEPSFETIDALDHGGSWPTLKTVLRASSAREILLAILSPDEAQEAALKAQTAWVNEAKEFILRSLGHKVSRGFDIYQKPDAWLHIGANDLGLRPCLETNVDVVRS